MMKKLTALTLLLLILAAPALAESPLLDQLAHLREHRLLSAVCDVLDAEELSYELDEEYNGCFLSVALSTPSVLGEDAYLALYAYEDGVSIMAIYAECTPPAHRSELIRLCNHLSGAVYLGKFYVDPYNNDLCYELFIPVDALNIRDFDHKLIADSLWTAVGTLDFYQEYFLMIVSDGETADNVFAMWEADMY